MWDFRAKTGQVLSEPRQTRQSVTLENCLVPPIAPGFWFPSSFLFFKHLSGPKCPIQPLSQHKPQREHIREMSELMTSTRPQRANAENKHPVHAAARRGLCGERKGTGLFQGRRCSDQGAGARSVDSRLYHGAHCSSRWTPSEDPAMKGDARGWGALTPMCMAVSTRASFTSASWQSLLLPSQPISELFSPGSLPRGGVSVSFQIALFHFQVRLLDILLKDMHLLTQTWPVEGQLNGCVKSSNATGRPFHPRVWLKHAYCDFYYNVLIKALQCDLNDNTCTKMKCLSSSHYRVCMCACVYV